MSAEFVHLKVHSEYSLIDGIVRINDVLDAAVAEKMSAIAITDAMNVFGLIKLYKKAMSKGIKPIIACDLRFKDEENEYLISAYAMNDVGYANMRYLLSRAYQENIEHGKAYIEREWLEQFNEGLLILSGAKFGDVGHALLLDKQTLAKQRLTYWMNLFPGRFYVELQRTYRPQDESYLHSAVALAEALQCPLVATNDVRFIAQDQFEAHEARVCIHQSRQLNDPKRQRLYSEEQYFKSSQSMCELFEDIPEAISNSVEIAKRCTVNIPLGKPHLPEYPIPDGMTQESFFRKVCKDGLIERFEKDILIGDESEKEQYWKRLDFEIDIILRMDFPGYFLIVMDFIGWAKDQNIPVGPGRGSGAGSLVAYALKITDLDPIRYDLLFERFLNPERISMPDFDIDFCQDRRDEVIRYVVDVYGTEAVSQIITFGTLAAKAVLRDVARVQGKPYGLGDRLSKMIPFAPGMTLEKAYSQEEDLRTHLAEDEEAKGVWDMAVQLEGISRNTGKHAAGVLISPTTISDYTPVYCVEGEEALVSQFDKDDVEDAGLVKFDFLGLKNLTIIQTAVDTVNSQRESGQDELDISQIALDDSAVYQLLQDAKTTAVFQLESTGMKELIARLKPSTFEDIIAMVALYRPGPLESGMVDDFINRKHGRQELAYPTPQFQHDCLIPILKPTYGIILYQEQVMQIAQEMGGYSLGAADVLRRAMGKKKEEEMMAQRALFVEGSVNGGFDEVLASNIFDLMEKFAGYGFNKSHSAAYALLAYQTAWLKHYHPAAFMAAVMSSDLQNTDKIVTMIEECRQMGVEILPPDVNQGEYSFTVDNHQRIIYGLGAIKGLGEGPIQSLIEERKANGPYTNLFDFCARTDSRKVNKRALEAIICSGAMDSLQEPRSLLMHSIPDAVKAAEQRSKNDSVGMTDLFGEVVSASMNDDVYESFRDLEQWDLKRKLQEEKTTLGLYLTGHPIDMYEDEIPHLSNFRLANLSTADKEFDNAQVFALIISVRYIRTKTGKQIAIVELDDRTGRAEIVMFSDLFEQHIDLLKTDNLIVINASVKKDHFRDGKNKLQVKEIELAENVRAKKIQKISLNVAHDCLQQNDFCQQLAAVLQQHISSNRHATTINDSLHQSDMSEEQARSCSMQIQIEKQGVHANYLLSDHWQVQPSDLLIKQLNDRFGHESVSLIYS